MSAAARPLDADNDQAESDDPDADLDVPPNALAPSAQTNAPPVETNAPAPIVIPPEAVAVEQTNRGGKHAVELLASFDGLGASFTGPQGAARGGNPSDNTLAVGPDHIVQIVNSRMAVFTKKGARFDTTGKALLGPVQTCNVFKGFGDADGINNGDAVVRYDQLANRWLIVMPIFRRLPNQYQCASAHRIRRRGRLEPACRDQPAGRRRGFIPAPAGDPNGHHHKPVRHKRPRSSPAQFRRARQPGRPIRDVLCRQHRS